MGYNAKVILDSVSQDGEADAGSGRHAVKTGLFERRMASWAGEPHELDGLVEDERKDGWILVSSERKGEADWVLLVFERPVVPPAAVPAWASEEIKATWRAAQGVGQTESFRLFERMTDRLGYGRRENNPSLVTAAGVATSEASPAPDDAHDLVKRARKDERAAIVAFLRARIDRRSREAAIARTAMATVSAAAFGAIVALVADSIERGEHHTEAP